MRAKMMRLTTLGMARDLRKRFRQGRELGKYSHLEEVRVRCVSNSALYHDHLEILIGRIAARQDLGPGQSRWSREAGRSGPGSQE